MLAVAVLRWTSQGICTGRRFHNGVRKCTFCGRDDADDVVHFVRDCEVTSRILERVRIKGAPVTYGDVLMITEKRGPDHDNVAAALAESVVHSHNYGRDANAVLGLERAINIVDSRLRHLRALMPGLANSMARLQFAFGTKRVAEEEMRPAREPKKRKRGGAKAHAQGGRGGAGRGRPERRGGVEAPYDDDDDRDRDRERSESHDPSKCLGRQLVAALIGHCTYWPFTKLGTLRKANTCIQRLLIEASLQRPAHRGRDAHGPRASPTRGGRRGLPCRRTTRSHGATSRSKGHVTCRRSRSRFRRSRRDRSRSAKRPDPCSQTARAEIFSW